MCVKKLFPLFIVVLLIVTTSIIPVRANERRKPVRIGIFPLPPIISDASTSHPHGLYPDLLRIIALEEHWDIEFVAGSQQEGLVRLTRGDIDLTITIATAGGDGGTLHRNREALLELRGQLFVAAGRPLAALDDLAGKRVGVVSQTALGRAFRNDLQRAGITIETVEYRSQEDVFNAIQQGEIEAGITLRHFGLHHAKAHDLIASSIALPVYGLYFTATVGRNTELLTLIDAHVARWKADPNSRYYELLKYWLGETPSPLQRIPVEMFYVLGTIAALALLFFLLARNLSVQGKRTARALRASEKQYRGLVEGSNLIILRLNRGGRILFVNAYALDYFGYRKDELVGEHVIGTIVPPEDSNGQDLEEMVATILRQPERYVLNENENMHKDGHRSYVQWNNQVILDESGDVKEILTIGTDITARKEAERVIAQRQAELEAIFDAITDAIVFADSERRVLMVNRAFSTIFGYDDNEVIGRKTKLLYASPEEFEQQGRLRFNKDASVAQANYVIDYRRQDGSVFPGETSGTPVKDATGKVIGLLGVIRDISAQRASAEEKEQLEAQLRQSSKMEAIGTLAGGIAHDFNNILGIVLSNTDIAMQLVSDDNKVRKNIDQIHVASQRAKELVHQILSFSRREQTQLVPTSVDATVRETMRLLRATIPASVGVTCSIGADCGGNLINADPAQLQQLLINLCTNAVHAMNETGSLRVELVRCSRGVNDPPDLAKSGDGDYLLLTVSDNGCGMSEEVRGKVFDPFFTTKEVGAGTGLGLSVAHGVVKSYGGTITVDSVAGEGSSFHIYLPVAESLAVNEVVKGAQLVGGAGEHILFVDDEECLAYSCKELLELHGFRVTSTTCGREALELFAAAPDAIDLVFTDQTMPEVTGLELATRLRAIRADIPIILCSGYAEKSLEQEALLLGIGKVCMKPLNMQQLVQAAREVLDKR